MPTSDEFVSGTDHRQNFEGGYIDYNTGDTSAHRASDLAEAHRHSAAHRAGRVARCTWQ